MEVFPEVIKDSINGYLVNEKDADMLQDRISYLLNNDSVDIKWGEQQGT